MNNFSQASTDIVRIGISPYVHSVSSCVLNPNPNACKNQGGVGIELEVLLIIFNLLQLQPKFILSNDLQCGNVIPLNQTSYSVTGLFKMLINDEIDMTGNVCGLNKERLLFTDASYPLYFSKQVFVLKKPVVEYNFDIWAPFSVPVWVTYVVCILFLGIILDWTQLCIKNPGWIYSLIKSSRRIDFVFDLTIGCFSAMYSSFVLISLMFPNAKPIPFKSGTELSFLVDNGQYRMVDFRNPPLIPQGNYETQARFRSGIAKHGFKLTGNTIKQMYDPFVNDSKLVSSQFDTWVSQDFNDYAEHGQLTVVEDPDASSNRKGYFWNPNFKYKNEINYFLSLSTSGLIETIRRRYLPNANRQDLTKGDNDQKLSLNMFANLFIMYSGCLLIAILVAIIECFVGLRATKQSQVKLHEK